MKNLIEKLQGSKDAMKGINYTQINASMHNVGKVELSLFTHSRKVAKLMHSANEWLNSKEGKSELDRLNIEAKAREILQEIIGKGKSQVNLLIQVGKLSDGKVSEYTDYCEKNKIVPTLKDCVKFDGESESESDGESDGESESEATAKVENFSVKVDNKNNKIAIKGTTSKANLTLLIAELKKLQKDAK